MDVNSGGVDLLPGERFFNLDYADDIILLCDSTQAIRVSVNQYLWVRHELFTF